MLDLKCANHVSLEELAIKAWLKIIDTTMSAKSLSVPEVDSSLDVLVNHRLFAKLALLKLPSNFQTTFPCWFFWHGLRKPVD